MRANRRNPNTSCPFKTSNSIGWEWLKGQLPAEALEALSAFDGLHTLTLRPDIRIALIDRTPELRDRILDACEALKSNEP